MDARHRENVWLLRAAALGFAAALILALPLQEDGTGQTASGGLVVEELGSSLTPQDLAELLVGRGVSISNVSYSGADVAGGIFSGGADILHLDQGIILTSGSVQNVVGPNSSDSMGTSNGSDGDSNLTALAGYETSDAAVLEFDFVPNKDRVLFQYVFASEEYNEFVNSSFNDVFAFYVNGQNCAVAGGRPVSINTINNGDPYGSDPSSNPELYRNNDLDDDGGSINTQMDGLTRVLTCDATVAAKEPNHVKLAIADSSDSVYDSAVFLQANSFSTTLNLRDWQMGDVHVHAAGDADLIKHRRCRVEKRRFRPDVFLSKSECASKLVSIVLRAASNNGARWVILQEHGPWLGGVVDYSAEEGRDQWDKIREAADELSPEIGVRALLGQELGTAQPYGHSGHFGSYRQRSYVPNGPRDTDEGAYMQEVVERGGWGAINHPFEGGSTWDCYYPGGGGCHGERGAADFAENAFREPTGPIGFRFLEITNDGAFPRGRTLRTWDTFLRQGYLVWPSGGSDAHTLSRHFDWHYERVGSEQKIGISRTFVFAPGAATPDAEFNSISRIDPIRQAMYTGRVVASNGPLAVPTLENQLPGASVLVEGAGTKSLSLKVVWKQPFAGKTQAPAVIRVILSTYCDFDECTKTMEYAPTDDEKQEGELEREIALPADWDNAYIRVEARRSTDNKSYGSFAAPIFIRRY